jgi:hypothetical protein
MKQRLRWLQREGIIHTGMWEPNYFHKMARGSGIPEAVWRYRHSAAHVDELYRAGINQIWTHWWKGYGLAFEHAEQERNRPLVAAAHKRGMRVIAYCTFGTIVPEVLEHEVPDCMSWAQVGEHGQPASCQTSFQSFRVRPCYNSQAWLDYLKRVTQQALEMGMDGIHFDNIGYNSEPDSCRCPTCLAKFRDYLEQQFGSHSAASRARGAQLFGFHDFSRVRAPWFNRWNQAVLQRQVNPSVQKAWMRFKVESIRGALQQMADHIRRVNPRALVEANAGKGFGCNVEYMNGLSPEVHFPVLDLVYNESGTLKTGAHGQLVTRTRECKLARAAGIPVMLYSRTPAEVAEMFAFNPGALSGGLTPAANAWYHRFKRYQLEAETLAEVAVLRQRESLAYNMIDPYAAVITAEQVLIENRIPYDTVWGRHLADLSKYRVLVLAGCECLSEREAAQVAAFVRRGGALLAVGRTAMADAWRCPYLRRGIRRVTSGAEAAAAMQPQSALHRLLGDNPQAPLRRTFGQGRVAYLPNFDYAAFPGGGPEFWMVTDAHYARPKNEADFLAALDWSVRDTRQLRVETSGRVLAELTRVGRETVLHLVNLDGEKRAAAVAVSLRLPRRVRAVSSLEFGGATRPAPVPFVRRGDTVQVEIPDLRVHRMLILR